MQKNNLYREMVEKESDLKLYYAFKRREEALDEEFDAFDVEFDAHPDQYQPLSEEQTSRIKAALEAEMKRAKEKEAPPRKKNRLTRGILLVAIVLAFCSIFALSASGFHFQFSGFLEEKNTEEYLKLSPTEETPVSENHDIPAELQEYYGYWYPTYLPEYFSFSNAEVQETVLFLTFEDSQKLKILFSQEKLIESQSYLLDQESEEYGKTILSDTYEGYWNKYENTYYLT